MVKVFFAGIAIFVLVVIGAFSAVFTPLLTGVNRNLGGNPKMPFHSPIPQPVIGAIHDAVGQATPSVLLTGVIALVALLIVYTAGSLVRHSLKRWKNRRRQEAELRWRARVMIEREQQAQSASAGAADAEFDALWE